jgi:diacylglycerol kinase (ATP)
MSHIDNINTYSWFVIANPTSGNRNFSKQWKEIQQLLKNKNLDCSFAFTQFSNMNLNWLKTLSKKALETLFLLMEMEHYIP